MKPFPKTGHAEWVHVDTLRCGWYRSEVVPLLRVVAAAWRGEGPPIDLALIDAVLAELEGKP